VGDLFGAGGMTKVARIWKGSIDGMMRLRASLPGYDAADETLSNEQLIIDTGWSEVLSVHAASWSTAFTTGTETISVSGGRWYRRYGTVTFTTLPWPPLAVAWWSGQWPAFGTTSGTTYTTYFSVAVSVTESVLTATYPWDTFSNGTNFAYIVFNKPCNQVDPREGDSSGANSVVVGNHPTRGPGFFASRRGADALTCGDDDLALSTIKPAFQIAESGSFWGSLGSSGIIRTVTLARAHPTRPPVLLATSDYANFSNNIQYGAQWVDDQTINIWYPSATASQLFTYVIPSFDPSFVNTSDVALTCRAYGSVDTGLVISKPNVDATTADPTQTLLRSDRSMLHVNERVSVTKPATTSEVTGTSALAVNVGGVPLTFFSAYWLSKWWVKPGKLGTGYYPADYRASGSPGTPAQTATSCWITGPSAINYVFRANSGVNTWYAAVVEYSSDAEFAIYSNTEPSAAESTWTDFSGATVGSAPSGFTIRYTNTGSTTMTVASVAGSTSGKVMRISPSSSFASADVSIDGVGSSVTDFDLLIGFQRTSSMTGTSSSRFGGAGHWVSGTSCVRIGLYSSLAIFQVKDTIDVEINYGITTIPLNTWHWLRIRCIGDRRYATIWQRGTTEPAMGLWLPAQYSGPVQAGRVCITADGSGSRTDIDYVSVCTTGRPAYGPV